MGGIDAVGEKHIYRQNIQSTVVSSMVQYLLDDRCISINRSILFHFQSKVTHFEKLTQTLEVKKLIITTLKSFWQSISFYLSLLSRHSREIINPYNASTITFFTSTVLFTCIWIPTNYCYARALITIPATDVTALFSTAPAFVFLLSMFILKEPPLLLRVRIELYGRYVERNVITYLIRNSIATLECVSLQLFSSLSLCY